MGDIAEVAKLLIGKTEEYGQLLGTKTFPLFVQREILWGHVNQVLGGVFAGLLLISILLVIVGGIRGEYEDAFFTTGFILFFISLFMSIGCFIKGALLLNSPELSAIKTILYMITRSGQ